jgi:hypothetical protein
MRGFFVGCEFSVKAILLGVIIDRLFNLFILMNATGLPILFRVLAFFSFCLILLPSLVSAQQSGIKISPATIEETLDAGEAINYTVRLTNLDVAERTYYLYARNISGVREGGVPIFAERNEEITGFELADWVVLQTTQITVPASGESFFDFTLIVPENASPGSHFGGIFVSVDPPEIENSGAAVGYQVANIISIRVSGEAQEMAGIREFSTSKFFYGSQNVDFNVRIENTGNVLVRPTGPLEVYNMLGNQVANFTFNPEQAAVFPNDERTYSKVNWTGDSIGFGRYEAILSPIYGDEGAKRTMSSTVTFWILPMNIIGPALLVLGTLLLIIIVSVKVYIKRSLAHINPGRRIVRQRRRKGSSATLLVIVVSLTVTALFLVVLLALFA